LTNPYRFDQPTFHIASPCLRVALPHAPSCSPNSRWRQLANRWVSERWEHPVPSILAVVQLHLTRASVMTSANRAAEKQWKFVKWGRVIRPWWPL